MFYSVVMETSQGEDTTPTPLVDLPSINSKLEHREDAISARVNGDSEVLLLEKQKASLATYCNIGSYQDILWIFYQYFILEISPTPKYCFKFHINYLFYSSVILVYVHYINLHGRLLMRKLFHRTLTLFTYLLFTHS